MLLALYVLTNFVSMPHPRKREQQLRGQHLRNALERNHGRRIGRGRELSVGRGHMDWGGVRGEVGPTAVSLPALGPWLWGDVQNSEARQIARKVQKISLCGKQKNA